MKEHCLERILQLLAHCFVRGCVIGINSCKLYCIVLLHDALDISRQELCAMILISGVYGLEEE